MTSTSIDFTHAGQQQLPTGKWAPLIDTWRNSQTHGRYKISQVSGGFGFDTEQEAHDAGHRAIALANETGRFPNMCERY